MSVISDADPVGEEVAGAPAVGAQRTHEQKQAPIFQGAAVFGATVTVYAVGIALCVAGGAALVVGVILLVIFGFAFGGLFVVQPNEARVLVLFGRYIGTASEP